MDFGGSINEGSILEVAYSNDSSIWGQIWGPPNLWKVTISSCRLKVSKVGYKVGASRIVNASSLL